MSYLPADTDPKTMNAYYDALRQIPPERRAELAMEASNFMRSVVEAGIRATYPQFSESQVQREVAKRLLGPELFRKAYTDRGL